MKVTMGEARLGEQHTLTDETITDESKHNVGWYSQEEKMSLERSRRWEKPSNRRWLVGDSESRNSESCKDKHEYRLFSTSIIISQNAHLVQNLDMNKANTIFSSVGWTI
ncbi:hypothetical protein AB6A40_002777 [Gnathostoma spinigerum]|uniref:Uncharacterized protein n=1 Tax=Gnathostoma spinigerum TaxID=75299 RepID=A0ABD6E7P4_9BILA